MILTLITIGIIIGAVICFIIDDKFFANWAFVTGMILMIIAIFASIFIAIGIFDAQINRDINYQNKLYEKEMLEYRIDNIENNIIGNEMLYNDIMEFNNELRNVKKWANNPWTNWFYNQDIASIDYIEIELDSN